MNATDTRDTDTFRDYDQRAATSNFGPAVETTVETFPAYTIVRRTGAFGKNPRLVAGELLGMKRPRGYYDTFSINSVVSYVLANDGDPITAVERAVERGHKLHWINGRATVISAQSRPAEKLIEVTPGMLVEFEGRVFEIVTEPNQNLGLKFIAMA